MSIVEEINCSHCGAPIAFSPGEILGTCKYCGYTVVIETGKVFTFEHSLLVNKYDPETIGGSIQDWMHTGFLKPSDLAKRSTVTEKNLIYLPFWVISVVAKSNYKGIFERIAPAIVKEGKIEKKYDWLVLARRATPFPTKEYDVPLAGKIPYDFKKIESFAQVFNSEISKDESQELAKQQIDEHHRYLIQQDVDRIVEMDTSLEVSQIVYLHAPVWFVRFKYREKTYELLIDGATGTVIRGEIPSAGLG